MKLLNKIGNLKLLAKSYLGKNPSYLILFVTARCNARCKMCFYLKNINDSSVEKELTSNEYEKISKNFKNLFYLSIGGGEPTLRDDLPEIIYYFYKNSGVRAVNISTNCGFPQKTYDIVQSIFEKCPNIRVKMSLSLDDLEKKHDEIRGLNGLFDKVLETHKLLSSIDNKNFALNIATTFSKLNKNTIYDLIDYVSDKLKINDHTLTYVRGDTQNEDVKDVTPNDYSKVWNYLIDKNKNKNKGFYKIFNNLIRLMYEVNQKTLERNEMILPCLAGKKFITLDEEGNIYPCEIISYIYKNRPFKMGNLRDFDYDINKILQREQSKDMMSFIKDSKCHCSFECGTLCNIAFSKKNLFKVLFKKF